MVVWGAKYANLKFKEKCEIKLTMKKAPRRRLCWRHAGYEPWQLAGRYLDAIEPLQIQVTCPLSLYVPVKIMLPAVVPDPPDAILGSAMVAVAVTMPVLVAEDV